MSARIPLQCAAIAPFTRREPICEGEACVSRQAAIPELDGQAYNFTAHSHDRPVPGIVRDRGTRVVLAAPGLIAAVRLTRAFFRAVRE
jgi:hypothetical protein